MTSKTHGPHRRNGKSEYQECTCKMDKSLNRGMFNKFESRKICVAGYEALLGGGGGGPCPPSEFYSQLCRNFGTFSCRLSEFAATAPTEHTVSIFSTFIHLSPGF